MSYDKYLILDLETTGLDPINDKIIKLTTTSFNDESFSSSETKVDILILIFLFQKNQNKFMVYLIHF